MIESWTFGEEPNLAARCNVSEFVAEKGAMAGGGLCQSERQVNCGGFTGAVRAQKSDNFSSFYFYPEISKRPAMLAREEGSIEFADTVEFEYRRHARDCNWPKK